MDIRGLTPDELVSYQRLKAIAYGSRFDPASVERAASVVELDRTVGVFEGDELIAGGVAYSFRASVPGRGREVPTAGLAGMTVLPTHRRRGLLTAMVRRQLEDSHERGEALSVLWASEAAIYPRFGYGLATAGCRYEIDRGGTAFLPGIAGAGRPRLLVADQAEKDKVIEAIAPVYEAVRAIRPGMVDRTPPWWRRRTSDPTGETLHVVVEGDAGIEAYAAYRVSGSWGARGPDNSIWVTELLSTTPGASAALWRFLFDVDLVQKVSSHHRPVDDPLHLMLADPRALRRTLVDGLWCRLVDLPEALAARSYAAPLAIVVEVTDALCPWNAGRWLLDAGPDGAACGPTAREPDLVLGASELGAIYLGGTAVEGLRQAGRVIEVTAGAAHRADAAFRWDPQPWGVTWF